MLDSKKCTLRICVTWRNYFWITKIFNSRSKLSTFTFFAKESRMDSTWSATLVKKKSQRTISIIFRASWYYLLFKDLVMENFWSTLAILCRKSRRSKARLKSHSAISVIELMSAIGLTESFIFYSKIKTNSFQSSKSRESHQSFPKISTTCWSPSRSSAAKTTSTTCTRSPSS